MSEKDTLILAIESSCDETAASVVKNGRCVLSNIISSQIAIHTLYGGVVPEIASRKHIEKINQVVEAALKEADVTLDDIDAIGVTYGPGLVGALLVGVAEAKAIAYAKKKPLVGVHHIEGHVSANYIEHPDLEPPFLCEIISGGHTHLVIVKDYGSFEILGRTRDDCYNANPVSMKRIDERQCSQSATSFCTRCRLRTTVSLPGSCWLSV